MSIWQFLKLCSTKASRLYRLGLLFSTSPFSLTCLQVVHSSSSQLPLCTKWMSHLWILKLNPLHAQKMLSTATKRKHLKQTQVAPHDSGQNSPKEGLYEPSLHLAYFRAMCLGQSIALYIVGEDSRNGSLLIAFLNSESQNMCGLVSGDGRCVDVKMRSQIPPLRKNVSPNVGSEDQKQHLVVCSPSVCFNWWEPSQVRLSPSHVNLPPAYETKPDLGRQGQGRTRGLTSSYFHFATLESKKSENSQFKLDLPHHYKSIYVKGRIYNRFYLKNFSQI